MAGKLPASFGPGGAAATSSSTPAVNPRSRARDTVTPNACNECRKKRAKCDGQNPCARCRSQGATSCIYKVPVRLSKDALRGEVQALQRSNDSNRLVLAALVRSDRSQDVLARLRSGVDVESISKWLGDTSHHEESKPVDRLPTTPTPNVSLTSTVYGGLHSISHSSGCGNHDSSMAGSGTPTSPVSSNRHQTVRHGGGSESHLRGSDLSAHSKAVLASNDLQPDVLHSTADTAPQSQMSGSQFESDGTSEQCHTRGSSEFLVREVPDLNVPAGTWTKITNDSQLVQHLFALYFCWEYPIFAPLSKEHFLKAFQDGDANHCSSILVNAILAIGCRFSIQPRTRADPGDPNSSGEHFFRESIRLLHQESNHHNLTTIQALGILSVREASRGRNSESRYHASLGIRLAIEMGLNLGYGNVDISQEDTVVELATFWGAFTLELVWSLATGSLPHYSLLPHLPPKPAVVGSVDASSWIPYTDDGKGAFSKSHYEQASNVRSVFRSFCELSELVHQSLYILYSPPRPVTGRALIDIYKLYIDWYDKIPEVLRLGNNFTPSVIFVHMYYHFAILVLFRHFIRFRIVNSAISPREVCLEAADAIQALSRSYSQLYTLRRTPAFTPYFVLMASTVHLTILGAIPPPISAPSHAQGGTVSRSSKQFLRPQQDSDRQSNPEAIKAISSGIEHLKEMTSCHILAQKALTVLLPQANKWRIEVNTEEDTEMTDELESIPHGAPALSSSSNHVPTPLENSATIFTPNVKEQDPGWLLSRSPHQPIRESGLINQTRRAWQREQKVDQADMPEMVEPDLWPFSMRHTPVLPEGDNLQKAGFELLVPRGRQ